MSVDEVTLKLEDVKILYESIIPIDIVGRFPARIFEKAVAMMQIYRYHNNGMVSVNGEKRGGDFLKNWVFSFFWHTSWPNLVERFFSKMTKQMLRGIRVSSRQELEDRIYRYFFIDFVEGNNWSFGGGMKEIVDGYYINANGTKGDPVGDE